MHRSRIARQLLLLSAFVTLLTTLTSTRIVTPVEGSATHTYNKGDAVVLWFNKIGPYHNPQETYGYYSLPFCQPDHMEHEPQKVFSGGIGETLEGNQLVNSGVEVHFKEDTKGQLCTKRLSKRDQDAFRYAVSQHYFFHALLDELPIWG